ncbi:MAG: superinfection immunity protein [Deltaproteobacteria bacterium]|nr:superinfection immunity protein [Deltaproteobacteria bacterium]
MPGWTAFLILAVGALLYLVPTFVAYRRRHHNRAAIGLLNVLLGWTFFGWAIALVWAATTVRSPWGPEPYRRDVFVPPPPAPPPEPSPPGPAQPAVGEPSRNEDET